MSIITTTSKNTARGRATATSKAVEETNEFDGLWLNLGVEMASPVEGEPPVFVRLPRGVAVSDLVQRKVYEGNDPVFAAQTRTMNQIIALIQTKALTLAEGESMPVNLMVNLYRRQEGVEIESSKEETASLENTLFGE